MIKWISTFILFWMFSALAYSRGVQMEEIRKGDALPSFSVLADSGDSISTVTLKGKPSLIVFFHTECWDCQKELPLLQEFYEKYKENVQFIAISRAQSEAAIRSYWMTNGLQFPYAAQKDNTVFKLFAEKTIPRIYISDDQGNIAYVFKEKVKRRRLLRALETILKEEK